jgi:hypothetical protein
VLTTLLPGLREPRAPLAAGYVWLLAGWIAFEPQIRQADGLTGFAAVLHRLRDALPIVGVAAVASFAAYLIGSLSITLCSPALRRSFLQAVTLPDGPRRVEPLSRHGLGAVVQLAHRSRKRMEVALAFSETKVADVVAEVPEVAPRSAEGVTVWRILGGIPRRTRRLRKLSADSPALPHPDSLTESSLIRAVTQDLEQILRTRLLGKDPEYFSAVDRLRAEVELRLAVIPPLLVLACSVAASLAAWQGVAVITGALVAIMGLYWDALNRQREGNDMLADALADGRVNSPTLERFESTAAAIATRPTAETMRNIAAEADKALADALTIADRLDSAPSSVHALRGALATARPRVAAVGSLLPGRIGEHGARTLAAIERVALLWGDSLQGNPAPNWPEDARGCVREAKAQHTEFRNVVRDEFQPKSQ